MKGTAMIRLATVTLAAVLAMTAPAIAAQTKTPSPVAQQIVVRDIAPGEGDTAVDGARVVVQYVGWLSDGTKFDSSYDRGTPFGFTIGQGEVIRGWELGIKGMRVGGRRELIVPPSLAYGDAGAGHIIGPGATLRFEIELMKVDAPTFRLISAKTLDGLIKDGTTVVDIRTDAERADTGTIAGAVGLAAFDQTGKLNRRFLVGLLKRVKKTDPLVLVDSDGKRTEFIGRFLSRDAGFTDLGGLDGGLKTWTRDGYTLSK